MIGWSTARQTIASGQESLLIGRSRVGTVADPARLVDVHQLRRDRGLRGAQTGEQANPTARAGRRCGEDD